MDTLIKVTIGLSILVLLFAILPFSIGLPGEMVDTLTGSQFTDIMRSIYFICDVDTALKCILLIFLASHFDILISMIEWIYNKIF